MADIVIKAKGSGVVNFESLTPMQGNLKELSEENYRKLHDLIISKGFDSPIQVWNDAPNLRTMVLDGHQRIRVLHKLKEEGWTIPDIPVDFIQADSYLDAKERLLTKVSVYGEVIEEGLYEFTNEEGAIIEPDFGELLDIPGIDFNKDEVEVKTSGEPSVPKEIECPNCHVKFDPKAI